MKTTELIKYLEKLVSEHGDLDVAVTCHDDGSGIAIPHRPFMAKIDEDSEYVFDDSLCGNEIIIICP